MKNHNGDKYPRWSVFLTIIGAVAMASIGLTLIFWQFTGNKQDRQDDKIDKQDDKIEKLQASMVEVVTHVKWIRELFEGKLQGVVDERVERMVQKQFEIALDPRISTPADRAKISTTTAP